MALGNRERIGKMFEAMAPALDEFITRVLGPDLPEGHTWIQLVALKDAQNGIQGKDYSPLDPQVQLRMLTASIPHQLKKGWYPIEQAAGACPEGLRQRAAGSEELLGAQSRSPTTTPTGRWTPGRAAQPPSARPRPRPPSRNSARTSCGFRPLSATGRTTRTAWTGRRACPMNGVSAHLAS